MDAYEDLPGHHLLSIRNLIATANDESYRISADETPPATLHGHAEWDFSSVSDPVTFWQFLDTTDCWFGCSDDSSIRSHDPARECFVVVVEEHADDANGAGDRDAPQDPEPNPPPTSPAGGADITAQLAQAHELEAKLTEEYRHVRLLRATIAGEASARGECVREAGRQARERINDDFNIDDPHTPPKASQKLIAAATLLRAMLEPSTLEAHNLHREAQALIEQAAVQQAESSASHIRNQSNVRGDGDAHDQEASVHAGGAAGQPANQCKTSVSERILDTCGQAQDSDAHNVLNAKRRGDAETRTVVGYHPR
jgi:hypothetical protein